VLVVNDGSTDDTAGVARAGGAELVQNPRNLGYARTQKCGFREALDHAATAVIVLHADGQYPPESLEDVLAPVLGGEADVVLGSRVLDGGATRRGMPLYKWIANRALSFLENRCYGLALSEYHTGMMAYSRRALEILPWEFVSDTFHFDGEMAMLAGRRGLRVREVPIPHVYAGERSHLRPIPYGFTVLTIALAVRFGLYDRWLERRAARPVATG
jgi:glycosyltransferase involved in cell wall biosynthesis